MFRRRSGGGVVFIDALFVRLDSAKRLQSISGESQLEFVALAPRHAALHRCCAVCSALAPRRAATAAQFAAAAALEHRQVRFLHGMVPSRLGLPCNAAGIAHCVEIKRSSKIICKCSVEFAYRDCTKKNVTTFKKLDFSLNFHLESVQKGLDT